LQRACFSKRAAQQGLPDTLVILMTILQSCEDLRKSHIGAANIANETSNVKICDFPLICQPKALIVLVTFRRELQKSVLLPAYSHVFFVNSKKRGS
jgi:hypothetical protein